MLQQSGWEQACLWLAVLREVIRHHFKTSPCSCAYDRPLRTGLWGGWRLTDAHSACVRWSVSVCIWSPDEKGSVRLWLTYRAYVSLLNDRSGLKAFPWHSVFWVTANLCVLGGLWLMINYGALEAVTGTSSGTDGHLTDMRYELLWVVCQCLKTC